MTTGSPSLRGLALATVAGLGALACGPGFQAVYEGNARFEHCYGLEETPQATMKEKADCWRDWSDHSTYGQTRDRVQYAIARYVALSQAPNVPTDEALMMAAPGVTPRVSTITAPAPTNAFAPPPKVLEADAGAPPPASATPLPTASEPPPPAPPVAAKGAAVPGAPCADTCTASFRSCSDAPAKPTDPVRTGGNAPRGGACEDRYKRCMRACFK